MSWLKTVCVHFYHMNTEAVYHKRRQLPISQRSHCEDDLSMK
jgi:hypothetical protein